LTDVTPNGGSFVRRLWSALRLIWSSNRSYASALVALQIVSAAAFASLLLVGRQLLREVLPASRRSISIHNSASVLVAVLVLLLAYSFATAAVAAIHKLVAERTIRHVTEQTIRAAGSVKLERFDSNDFYDGLQRVLTNSVTTPLQIALNAPNAAGALVMIAAIMVALARIQPFLIPVTILGVIPLWIAVAQNSEAIYAFSFGHAAGDRARNHFSEVLTERPSASEVRAFHLRDFILDQWNVLYDKRIADVRSMVKSFLVRTAIGSVFSAAITAATIALLILLVESGHMDVAGALTSVLAIQQLSSRLQALGVSLGVLYEQVRYLDDYEEFLAAASASETAPHVSSEVAPKPFQKLEVRDVTFTYPGEREPALVDVAITVNRGEVVALVGENGSGKTTLAKLLCNLYSPSGGKILWDGVDVAEFDEFAFAKEVAPIFQDFVRYRLSALDNIRVGAIHRSLSDEEIIDAARKAGAHEFISRLPNGYSTLLSKEYEEGSDLSVGQWQRVALARAFFRQASFVVLDEPTAALDPRAEFELFETMRALSAGNSVLLISHRFSSVRGADRIYVLDKGRIVEQGTHSELVSVKGLYAMMFAMQASAYVDGALEGSRTD
jgi:ATP-binding cassette subfamily B protein